ncbi:hypothetical protein FA13DRAFT_1736627 [Coprinellus micaceus]|uniref:Uncharacterized protein n=1 Tax=Coprinellus micaceus TaxID=71717 RepID=A0A4Y7SZF5_COPMI|nr:hypothetical protein FA13DRAFT_1736627 [Coprinellus micaceus]
MADRVSSEPTSGSLRVRGSSGELAETEVPWRRRGLGTGYLFSIRSSRISRLPDMDRRLGTRGNADSMSRLIHIGVGEAMDSENVGRSQKGFRGNLASETAQLDGPRVVYLSVASSIAFTNEEWPQATSTRWNRLNGRLCAGTRVPKRPESICTQYRCNRLSKLAETRLRRSWGFAFQ